MGTGGGTHQLIWLVLLPFSNKEGSFFGLHSLKIAIAGNIAGIYFGGACFQAFTQDRTGFVLHTVRYFCETSFTPYGFHLYTTTTVLWNSTPYGTSSKPWFSPYGFHLYTTTTVLWNSIPYGTSSKPWFSPYGFHLYTTTVRSFWIYRTVQHFTFTSKGTVRALFCIPYGTSAKLHSARTGFICTQIYLVYHSPLEFNTVRYFFKTLIQPVRVSFVHNYRTVQHFTFTSKGRGFLSLWLDPTPSHLVTGARTCYHSLTISKLFPRCRRYACQLSSVQK